MPDFSYTLLDNDIHKLTLNKATRNGVDEMIEQFTQIIRSSNPHGKLLVLVDLRPDGLPSVSYSYPKLRSIFAQRATIPRIYAAYLHTSAVMLPLMQTFLDILRANSSRRFFEGQREEEAIEWLLTAE